MKLSAKMLAAAGALALAAIEIPLGAARAATPSASPWPPPSNPPADSWWVPGFVPGTYAMANGALVVQGFWTPGVDTCTTKLATGRTTGSMVGALCPGRIVTKWQASVSGQSVDLRLSGPGFNYAGPPVQWINGAIDYFYPLADFAGLTMAQLQTPNNPAVLKITMNIRQGNPYAFQGDTIALSPALATTLGHTLTDDFYRWMEAPRSILDTQGYAGGPIPPVPVPGVPPDPAVGVYCWGNPATALANLPAGSCTAPEDTTTNAQGVITWPGYPASVIAAYKASTQVSTPAQVVSKAKSAVSSAVQKVTSTVSSHPASNTTVATSPSASATSSKTGTAAPSQTTTIPPVTPTSNPTTAQAIQQAAHNAEKRPVPTGDICSYNGSDVPCVEDPQVVGVVTPSTVSQAKAQLKAQAATNHARQPWRNRGAIGLLVSPVLLVIAGIAALAWRRRARAIANDPGWNVVTGVENAVESATRPARAATVLAGSLGVICGASGLWLWLANPPIR